MSKWGGVGGSPSTLIRPSSSSLLSLLVTAAAEKLI